MWWNNIKNRLSYLLERETASSIGFKKGVISGKKKYIETYHKISNDDTIIKELSEQFELSKDTLKELFQNIEEELSKNIE